MKINSFEELDIWKLATETAVIVYKLTSRGLFLKDYGLTDQIRRAAISIASNITEGFERNNNNEFIYFLKISKGSCGELRTQLFICFKIGYITEDEYMQLSETLKKLSSMIGKFISYLHKKKQNKEFTTR